MNIRDVRGRKVSTSFAPRNSFAGVLHVSDFYCYGTSEGAKKAWDTRGRGGSKQVSKPIRNKVSVGKAVSQIDSKLKKAAGDIKNFAIPIEKRIETGHWMSHVLNVVASKAILVNPSVRDHVLSGLGGFQHLWHNLEHMNEFQEPARLVAEIGFGTYELWMHLMPHILGFGADLVNHLHLAGVL